MIDPRGNTHLYFYDSLGRLIRDEDPAGGFITLERTELERGWQIVKSNALRTTGTCRIESTATGELIKTNIRADGTTIQAAIGLNGDWSHEDRDGVETSYVLGPDPRWGMQSPILESTTIRTPMGLEYSLTHTRTASLADPSDPLSRLLEQTDEIIVNGKSYTTTYDADLQTLTRTTPEGRERIQQFDQGKLIRNTTPGLAPMLIEYDSFGRRISAAQGSRETWMTYDSAGGIETYTDALGRVTTFEMDAAGWLTAMIDNDGLRTSYENDAAGNLTAVIMPSGATHQLTHNALNLLEEYIAPNVGDNSPPMRFTYNAAQQLVGLAFPDDRHISWSHDDIGRVSRVEFSRGAFQRIYDPITGNLSQVDGPYGSALSYEYDGSLRVGRVWTGAIAGAVRQSFDDDFRVAYRTVEGGSIVAPSTVEFTRDNDGLLIGAGDLAIERNPLNGFVTGMSLGGLTQTFAYDQYGEVITHEVRSSASTIYLAEYTRDAASRIIRVQTTISGEQSDLAYGYDSADRLTEVTKDGIVVAEFTYDNNGNRLSVVNESGTTNATYDAQDRIVQFGSLAYDHNASGQLTRQVDQSTGATTTFDYDEFGNLIQVQLDDGSTVEYIIDPVSRRLGKKVNGALVQGLLYKDLHNPVAELDENGQLISRFVYAARRHVPDYMMRDGHIYQIVSDHLGSPRLVINTVTTEVVQVMEYNAFGQVMLDTNPGFQPFGFAGGLYDGDTGRSRFGARDYDPVSGRWMAKDPALFDAGTGNENLYVYVSNNPTTLVDPTGKDWTDYACSSRRPILGDERDPNHGKPGRPGYRDNPETGCREFVDEGSGETPDGAGAWRRTFKPKKNGSMEIESAEVDLESSGDDKPTTEVAEEARDEFEKEQKERKRREEGKGCGNQDDCTKPKVEERCDSESDEEQCD
jgi:RHS repeat-associated protein